MVGFGSKVFRVLFDPPSLKIPICYFAENVFCNNVFDKTVIVKNGPLSKFCL